MSLYVTVDAPSVPLKRYEVRTRDAAGNFHWLTVDATHSRGAIAIAKKRTNAVQGTCVAYLGPTPLTREERAAEIARSNANAAIDQWEEYRDYDHAIHSYAVNVRDTLAEEGLQDLLQSARKVYYARIAELL